MIVFKNDHISLRTWSDDDIGWYSRLVADPDVMRHIGDGKPRDADRAKREIDAFQKEQSERGWSRWVAESVSSNMPLGFVGFSVRKGKVDWGARAFRQNWGSRLNLVGGFMAVEAGLLQLGIENAVAFTVLENKSAWRCNEVFGFQYDGTILQGGTKMVRQVINRSTFISSGQMQKNRHFISRLTKTKRPKKSSFSANGTTWETDQIAF